MRYPKSCWLMLLITVSLELTNKGLCRTEECRGSRCGRHGPSIRFPFRRNYIDPDHCGYPGFNLTCHENHALLELPAFPLPIQFRVTDIDHNDQIVFISDPENCVPKQLLKLNQSSISPFQFTSSPLELNPSETYLFFNCPPNEFSCPYVALAASASPTLLDSGLISCTRMFNTILSDYRNSDPNVWTLRWFKPDCSKCEARGKLCKLNNNSTEDAIQCYEAPPKAVSEIHYAAIGVPVGSAILLLVFFAFFKIYHYFRIKGEDLARVEKFLQDYRAFRPTRFSYADIYRITNHLKDKLGEGTHGAVFKGKVS